LLPGRRRHAPGEPIHLRLHGDLPSRVLPSGPVFRDQPTIWPDPALSWGPDLATPGGTLLGDVCFDAGQQLPLQPTTATRACRPRHPAGSPLWSARSEGVGDAAVNRDAHSIEDRQL
jgi:hypothetical protein